MERFVHIGETRLWTTISGTDVPCILCNGGPGCDDYLAPVSEMIDDLCQVVRFEPRGCGRSDYDGNYELEQTIEDIECIREAYGFERLVIGGHSAGVDVALAYTIRFPDNVLGLFGLAGGRIVNDRDWSEAYHRNREKYGEDLGGKVFVSDPRVNDIGNATWRKYIKRKEILRDISRINVPAIFINAGKDIRPNWPTEQLAHLIPKCEYYEIRGAAHMIWLTHYEELKTVLRGAIETIKRGMGV